jgi:hypothetical protein
MAVQARCRDAGALEILVVAGRRQARAKLGEPQRLPVCAPARARTY